MKLFFTHKPLAMQNNCTKAESYQKLIRRDERIRKTVGITGFFEFFELFPLHRCRGLGSNIVGNAVDVGHLIDDTHRYTVQHLIGDAGPLGGHEVGGLC